MWKAVAAFSGRNSQITTDSRRSGARSLGRRTLEDSRESTRNVSRKDVFVRMSCSASEVGLLLQVMVRQGNGLECPLRTRCGAYGPSFLLMGLRSDAFDAPPYRARIGVALNLNVKQGILDPQFDPPTRNSTYATLDALIENIPTQAVTHS